jgi:molybdopterin-guanine dinucleotide biosynthesis protein A
MGQYKEGIPLADGRPMIEHVIEAVRGVCAGDIAIVGRCTGWSIEHKTRIRQIQDRHTGCGPMAGLEALLASGMSERYLVVTCDQPLLTADLLRRLTRAPKEYAVFFKAEDGKDVGPFPCVLPADWLIKIESLIAAKDLSVQGLMHSENIKWVTLPNQMKNLIRRINTKKNLAAILRDASMQEKLDL